MNIYILVFCLAGVGVGVGVGVANDLAEFVVVVILTPAAARPAPIKLHRNYPRHHGLVTS